MENIDVHRLETQLNDLLKKKLKNIVFLELNKDIYLGRDLRIQDNIPLPIRSADIMGGVKIMEYSESIDFSIIIDAMIYLIGCDRKFKYSNSYMDILKKVNTNIDSYILSKGMEFSKEEDYVNALIYFRALEKMSDNHLDVARYNMANTLRLLALSSKEGKNSSLYDLYYSLSYNAFLELCRDFPEFSYGHYYLGFYYFNDGMYEDAVEEWEEAFRNLNDEEIKDEIEKLTENAKACHTFERGREEIIEGDIIKGLKSLIPLSEKFSDWSEIKFYIALGYRKFGNYEKAKIILNELLTHGEESSEIYNELGLCCFTLGETNESIEHFKKALSMMQDHPVYLCNLAMALYEAGDIEGAKKNIYRAYELNPEDEFAIQIKNWIGGA